MRTPPISYMFLKGMSLLSLILTSIMLHELVHLTQFTLNGSQVTEVVLLGWKTSPAEPAIGWVGATSSVSLNTNLMEIIAYTIQFLYLFLGNLFLTKTVFNPLKENS